MPSNDYFRFLDEEAAQAEWDALIEARRKHWNVRDEDVPPVWLDNYVARARRLIGSDPEDYVI